MSALNIPGEGERFLGVDPQILKVKKVTVGAAASNDVVLSAVETKAIANIAAGIFVMDVWANVNTAFTATVTLTIGDGTSAAGFFSSANIAPQTAVTSGLFKKASASAGAFASGKYYAAADTIDIVVGVATVAAGQMDVYILYVDNLDDL